MDAPLRLIVFISLLAFVTSDDNSTSTTGIDPVTVTGTDNTTSENITTTSTAEPIITTTVETNTSASTEVTTETTETSKSSADSSTTEHTTGSPVPEPKSGGFNALSFIGGIVLCLGVFAIGYVGFKFYKSRTERNYHTL